MSTHEIETMADLMRVALDGRPIAWIAGELGVSRQAVHRWGREGTTYPNALAVIARCKRLDLTEDAKRVCGVSA